MKIHSFRIRDYPSALQVYGPYTIPFSPFSSHLPYHLKVSNRIRTRLHPRSHVPILNQTRSDHPPNTGDIALSERDAVASKVDGAKRRAGQIGAHEDTLNFHGAAFELCALEGDDDCSAVL